MTTKNNPAALNPSTKSASLNAKELAVLKQVADGPATLEAMSKRFRRADDAAQSNSWARNSVRKPCRLGLMKKAGRGTYAITAKGSAYLLQLGGRKPAKAAGSRVQANPAAAES